MKIDLTKVRTTINNLKFVLKQINSLSKQLEAVEDLEVPYEVDINQLLIEIKANIESLETSIKELNILKKYIYVRR